MDRRPHMHPLRKRPGTDDSEGIVWRLVAALIAVPVFELSLLFGIYVLTPGRGAAYAYMLLPMWLHAVYAALAVGTGLLFGFKGLTWLLGHLFLTHHENERNTFITALLWGVLAGLALAASYFVPSS